MKYKIVNSNTLDIYIFKKNECSSTENLKMILDSYGLSIESLKYDHYGKPYLSENPCFISISRCNDIAIVGICCSEIGIDIEFVKMFPSKVASRFFHEDELKELVSSPEDLTAFKIWTAKEAYLKYLGIGLSKNMRYFSVFDKLFHKNLLQFEFNNYICSVYTVFEKVCSLKINVF